MNNNSKLDENVASILKAHNLSEYDDWNLRNSDYTDNLSKKIVNNQLTEVETDININPDIREKMFNQIEDLNFDCSDSDVPNCVYINVALASITKANIKPFKFLFDLKNLSLVPQYTETHRVYNAKVNTKEYNTLANLAIYVKDYLSHKRKVTYDKMNEIKNNYLCFMQGINSSTGVDFIIPPEIYDYQIEDDNTKCIDINTIEINLKNTPKDNILYIELSRGIDLTAKELSYRVLLNPDYTNSLNIQVSIVPKSQVNVDSITTPIDDYYNDYFIKVSISLKRNTSNEIGLNLNNHSIMAICRG